jgi:uncharacterized membrane protein YfcA
MTITLTVLVIVFLGVLTQTVSGFGLGLVAMPLLTTAIGLDSARPLVALISVASQVIMLVKLRKSLTMGAVSVMAITGLIGIPIGSYLAEAPWLSENTLLTALALIVIIYSLYSLFAPTLPELKNDRWLSAFGFTSGILTGAYNVGGPPVVIYGNARRWTPEQMRSNLQGISLFKTFVLVIDHALRGNFTRLVLTDFTRSFPVMLLAMVVGFFLASRIDVIRFRQLVLILLLIIGGKILFDIYLHV